MLCCSVPQPWLSVSLVSTIPYPHIMFDIPFVYLIRNLPRQSADAWAGRSSSSLVALLDEKRHAAINQNLHIPILRRWRRRRWRKRRRCRWRIPRKQRLCRSKIPRQRRKQRRCRSRIPRRQRKRKVMYHKKFSGLQYIVLVFLGLPAKLVYFTDGIVRQNKQTPQHDHSSSS